jgi:hypothetical protein
LELDPLSACRSPSTEDAVTSIEPLETLVHAGPYGWDGAQQAYQRLRTGGNSRLQ